MSLDYYIDHSAIIDPAHTHGVGNDEMRYMNIIIKVEHKLDWITRILEKPRMKLFKRKVELFISRVVKEGEGYGRILASYKDERNGKTIHILEYRLELSKRRRKVSIFIANHPKQLGHGGKGTVHWPE